MTASPGSSVAPNVAETLQESPSQRCNVSTGATATFPSEAIRSLYELQQQDKLRRGDFIRIAESFAMKPSTLRAQWHYYRHPEKRPQASSGHLPKTSSKHHQLVQGGGVTHPQHSLKEPQKPPMPDEEFLEQLVSSLSSPRVHDVHAVIREVPQAFDRAPLYGFSEIAAGNLSHFAKQCSGYSAEVYRNGTIKLIIDASSQGGLDAEEFTDAFFRIGTEIYQLVMRPLSLKDFEVVELHFNVDKQLTGWAPKFKTVTVKTLTGVLLRAYEKTVQGEKKLRIEACGSPGKANDVLAILNGGASVQNFIYQQQQVLMAVMEELKQLRSASSHAQSPFASQVPAPSPAPMPAPVPMAMPAPLPLPLPQAQRQDKPVQSGLPSGAGGWRGCPFAEFTDEAAWCGRNFLVAWRDPSGHPGSPVPPERAQLFEQFCATPRYAECPHFASLKAIKGIGD